MTLQSLIKRVVETKLQKNGFAYSKNEDGSQAIIYLRSKDEAVRVIMYLFATDMHITLEREGHEIMHVSGEYADMTEDELKTKVNASIEIIKAYNTLAEE